MAIIKRQITSVGEDAEKLDSTSIAGGNAICGSHCENSVAVSQMVKELPYYPAILLLCIYPREQETYIHIKTCIHMFMTTLFTTVKEWKLPKWPST